MSMNIEHIVRRVFNFQTQTQYQKRKEVRSFILKTDKIAK